MWCAAIAVNPTAAIALNPVSITNETKITSFLSNLKWARGWLIDVAGPDAVGGSGMIHHYLGWIGLILWARERNWRMPLDAYFAFIFLRVWANFIVFVRIPRNKKYMKAKLTHNCLVWHSLLSSTTFQKRYHKKGTMMTKNRRQLFRQKSCDSSNLSREARISTGNLLIFFSKSMSCKMESEDAG